MYVPCVYRVCTVYVRAYCLLVCAVCINVTDFLQVLIFVLSQGLGSGSAQVSGFFAPFLSPGNGGGGWVGPGIGRPFPRPRPP